MTEFAKIVREGRERTGQSLKELSLIFKAHPGTISRWENGHSSPTKAAQEIIAEYFR